ncbi:hypothetical protein J6590_018523 [Homalodisca vitripennis]|nr:hypothetical protein J6590_018523 [Homalodisca vitripennis]
MFSESMIDESAEKEECRPSLYTTPAHACYWLEQAYTGTLDRIITFTKSMIDETAEKEECRPSLYTTPACLVLSLNTESMIDETAEKEECRPSLYTTPACLVLSLNTAVKYTFLENSSLENVQSAVGCNYFLSSPNTHLGVRQNYSCIMPSNIGGLALVRCLQLLHSIKYPNKKEGCKKYMRFINVLMGETPRVFRL